MMGDGGLQPNAQWMTTSTPLYISHSHRPFAELFLVFLGKWLFSVNANNRFAAGEGKGVNLASDDQFSPTMLVTQQRSKWHRSIM